MKALPSIFAALLLSTAAPAVRADEVDDYITKLMTRERIPGLSLLITKDDQVVKRSVYGKASVELDVPMTTEHVFESGSIGKSFTATVILMLAEEGKLSLDDPLSKYVDRAAEAWKPIKIRQLLNQVSGLPDYATVPGLGLVEKWTLNDWFEKLSKVPMDFETGKQFAYSNTNYLLLGLIAEKAGGKPILELVDERIFKPLGMTRSYVADEMQVIPYRSRGYIRTPQAVLNGLFIAPGYGDGSLINSPEDLAKFEKGIREDKLLKPESRKLLQESALLANGRKTGYGMGWFVRDVNGVRIVSHGGNTAGFSASMTRVPSANLTIVMMCNVHDLGGDGIAQKIAELYVPSLKFAVLKEAADPHPDTTAKYLATLKELAAGKTEGEMFDKELMERLKTGRGRMGLRGYAPFANVATLAYLQTTPNEPDKNVQYRATVGERNYVVTFIVTKENKIYAVSIRAEEPASSAG